MRPFQAAYIGRHEFPKNLSEFDLRHWFTFDERDRRSIRKAFRSRYWIGAALHLGFLAMTGTTLGSLEYVPAVLLRHLGRQFVQKAPDLATLRSLYRRSQTLYEHQRWAAEQWGLGKFTDDVERPLAAYPVQRTHATLSSNRLGQMAYEWLYRGYLEIPSRRVITDLVRTVIHTVVHHDHEVLRKHRGQARVNARLPQLLEHRPGHSMTYLEWLRRPPRRRSMKTLREPMAKYQWLEQHVEGYIPLTIPKERQLVYARRMGRRRASNIPRLPVFRQELETNCFAAVTLAVLVDDILQLIQIRICAIWTWAYKIAADRVTPQRLQKRGEILAELRRMVTDEKLTDTAFRKEASAILLPDQAAAPPTRAADVREVLTRNSRRIRPVLEALVKLDLRVPGSGGDGLAWLKDTHKDGVDQFYMNKAPTWTRRWDTLIEDPDSGRSLRAYEAASVSAVRQGLRNGSLYSFHGTEFSDPARHLMPPPVWEARRRSLQMEKGLPHSPERYTDCAEAALQASLAGLKDAVAAGDVWVGRKDLYFRRDEAAEQPEGVELAQISLFRDVGRVQLPTLLLELDARVRFSWKLLGRKPRKTEELLGLYGALLAAGTDLESRGVARMIRGVHESTIRRYMRLLEAEPAMREANDALLQFARSHSIVNHWGTGYEASSDLMSLDASKHLYDARVDPKRRVHGMGVYQTILAQWGIVYDQPLPLLRRQVGAAIEGVVRQRTTPIRWLAVDTHGHTHIERAIAKLLGFDLYARQDDMRHQWLHLPRDWPAVPGLEPVVRRDLDLGLMHAELDELLRVAASINDGYGSATYLLERPGVRRPRLPIASRRHAVRAVVGYRLLVRLRRSRAVPSQCQWDSGARGVGAPARARHPYRPDSIG